MEVKQGRALARSFFFDLKSWTEVQLYIQFFFLALKGEAKKGEAKSPDLFNIIRSFR